MQGSFIIPFYPPPPFASPIALDYNGPHRSDQGCYTSVQTRQRSSSIHTSSSGRSTTHPRTSLSVQILSKSVFRLSSTSYTPPDSECDCPTAISSYTRVLHREPLLANSFPTARLPVHLHSMHEFLAIHIPHGLPNQHQASIHLRSFPAGASRSQSSPAVPAPAGYRVPAARNGGARPVHSA